MNAPLAFLDGAPVADAALLQLAQFNHGHFTSMQVREGAVRGLDLHLQRLSRDAREVFDAELDEALVRLRMRQALGERRDASLRVAVFAHNWNARQLREPAQLGLLVSVSDPVEPAATPLRLWPVRHERFLPHVKHAATFDLFALRRRAQLQGFDDALFMDADGCISEGSTWNIGFFDGESVVWPQAPQLRGVTMRLLQHALESDGMVSQVRPVPLAQVPGFVSAFVCNASGAGRAVAGIGDVAFRVDSGLIERLAACYRRQPSQAL